MRKKIEKNFWDTEIIGNRRKKDYPSEIVDLHCATIMLELFKFVLVLFFSTLQIHKLMQNTHVVTTVFAKNLCIFDTKTRYHNNSGPLVRGYRFLRAVIIFQKATERSQ